MRKPLPLLIAAATAAASLTVLAQAPAPVQAGAPITQPTYVDGKLQRPDDYREWIYLTTGFDMSYSPARRMGHHMFDNVFVNPQSWRAFLKTGTWPDKTILVVEVRGAEGKGSINQAGNFQGTMMMGLEVHVRDAARFPGKWAFFAFDDNQLAQQIPENVDCYACHAAHGAVDTTFVQFYPTLLPIAQAKGTFSAAYLEETKKP